MHILFSDYFQVDKDVVESYGAFDISLVSDLPLFIDPFLLFHSRKDDYKELHDSIITYLKFLMEKSLEGEVEEGLLRSWYYFQEVKQTWLGYAEDSNGGRGLAKDFAESLNRNLSALFGEQRESVQTKGKHLEKLCLLKDGVGRDNISDFTTVLIKEFLLDYTQDFARSYIDPKLCSERTVSKVRFNFETENWESDRYYLPIFKGDFVLLVPRDILTRGKIWINKDDLLSSFDELPELLDDKKTRAEINNYFKKILSKDAKDKEKKEAMFKTFNEFPELLDCYVRMKEEDGDSAVESSGKKVSRAESIFLDKFIQLSIMVAGLEDEYTAPFGSFDGLIERLRHLKSMIENEGASRFFFDDDGKPVRSEEDMKVARKFVLFSFSKKAVGEVKSEPIAVEFKLANSGGLKKFLDNRNNKVEKDEKTKKIKKSIVLIFACSVTERVGINEYLRGFKSEDCEIIVVDLFNKQQVNISMSNVTKNPTVFISYSHDLDVWEKRGGDPETQKQRVFQLSESLRSEGVECTIDQHTQNPAEGWPRWMMNQIEKADFVLVVGTETYNRRFRGHEEPNKGFGAQWEGAVITQELYDANGQNLKFVPIIFESEDALHIPIPLRSATHYNVSSRRGYNDLYFYLTNQPPYIAKPLGPIRRRPDQGDDVLPR